MLKYKELKPTRFGFGEGLAEIGRTHKEVVVLGADISNSVSVNYFKSEFPDRFFSIGIAEQNLAGVAAGLALGGKIPFFSTYGVFAALRTTDQIRVSICYNHLNVKIGGAHAGLSVGQDGATHQALEDLAIMRVLPGMTVLSPCDATQTQKAVIASVEQVNGPVYIRFGREAVPDFSSSDLDFVVGKAQIFRLGTDVTICATGNLLWQSLLAAEQLASVGLSARVVNFHTIKPIDEQMIIQCAKETGAFVCAEEHQISGGFGGAVAEITARFYPVPIEFIGVKDCFGESGKPEELMEKYGLTAQHIFNAAQNAILRKIEMI